jgi:nucleoside-diphosphate-sugar epimerase
MVASARPKLLITGAGGFVGAASVRVALSAGYHVVALVRRPGSRRLAAVSGLIEMHAADLSNTAAIAAILANSRPDIVIHSAWEGVGGTLRASDIQFENIRTACALADAAIAAGVRKFVGIGSQAEYGRFNRRITEADLPQPSMLYGAAKLAASHLIRQRAHAAGMDFAWLRLFSVYGPGDNGNWLIPSSIAEMLRGRAPRTTAGTQRWDYLHIDDVARGVLDCAVTDEATGTFNLSSGIPVTVRSILEMARDRAAPGLALRFGDIPFGPDQIMHLEGDNGLLRGVTGWSPQVPLDLGLVGTVNAMRLAA